MLRLTTFALLALMAQQPSPNTALIVGRVVDQTDGKPISGAVVEISADPSSPARRPRRFNSGDR